MLLRKGDWAGAAAALEKAAAGLPRNAEAHARLGTAYQFTRRTPEALAAYRKAVELDPKNLDYRTTYGIMLGINKDYAGGVAELKKVIATPGYKSPDAYLNLGWLYRNMEPRRAEESVAAYKKALELDPTNEQAALGMAWAYSYLKRYDDSIAAFNKAMELEPDLAADAYNGIAWGHFFKKDLPQAEAFLAKAKAAGRNDARLADNIDRVKKGLEAKAAEPIDEPAPAPRVADPGTLNQILQTAPSLAARCKAARDLGKLGLGRRERAHRRPRRATSASRPASRRRSGTSAPRRASAVPHLLAARGALPDRQGDPDRRGPEERSRSATSSATPCATRWDGSASLAGRRRPAAERLRELAQVSLRHRRAAGDAVRGRPAALGQVVRAEQPVEHRQVDGEVLVHRLRLRRVVPVVELRRGQQPAQRPELEPHVGVDEGRLDADERHVGEQRPLREPEDVDRDVGQAARHRHVHQVQPRAGQPVHRLRRVVDGVEAPERGHAVERAVDPVLGEVGEDEDRGELDRRGQRRDLGRHRGRARPVEQHHRRLQGQQRDHLDEQRADEEVREVGPPVAAEDRLLRPQREEAAPGG